LRFTRIDIAPTILPKKIEEQLIVGAFIAFSTRCGLWKSQPKCQPLNVQGSEVGPTAASVRFGSRGRWFAPRPTEIPNAGKTAVCQTELRLSGNLSFPRESFTLFHIHDRASWLALALEAHFWRVTGTIVGIVDADKNMLRRTHCDLSRGANPTLVDG
jgi:hypothetical protein